MLSPEVFSIRPRPPAMPQRSIDVGQRLLSEKSDYPCVTPVADRHRAYTQVQFLQGEFGCKHFLAVIVTEHLGLLLSA